MEDSAEVYKRVSEIIKEVLRIEESSIKPDSRIKEDLNADSLDTVSLLMALEEEFGESIDDQEAAKLTTPQTIAQYIESRMKLS
ncbi:Acyl carrier protein [Chitinispirillum alkaliphilum]|nr:Acyl carrier protein [Chitinispirillum alkaliphilum]